jgi:hypothetical protein
MSNALLPARIGATSANGAVGQEVRLVFRTDAVGETPPPIFAWLKGGKTRSGDDPRHERTIGTED